MGKLSFDNVYHAYSALVYWVAMGVAHNHDTALEITQLVFMRAYEKWDIVGELAPLQAKSWLYKASRNAAIDRLRKERREVMTDSPPDVAAVTLTPETEALRSEETRVLWRLVQELPVQYRAPILLHYFAHLSQQEAASALGLTDSTYRSRLTRARAMLEKKLKKEGISC